MTVSLKNERDRATERHFHRSRCTWLHRAYLALVEAEMTLLSLIIAALIWLGISYGFCLWFCPRLFRYVPQDDE